MIDTDQATSKVTPLGAARRLSPPSPHVAADARYWSEQMAAVASCRDRDGFMRIYDHFAPRLQRYLLGLGVAQASAEELVQEAMLRVWRRADLFDPARASLATWLFRIARNLYIDTIRSEPNWMPVQDGLEWLDSEAASDPASDAEAFVDHAGLKQAIDELPAAQARLIRMSYFEAKAHREIAAELNMPLGTVKSSLRRAFGKLQAGMRRTR